MHCELLLNARSRKAAHTARTITVQLAESGIVVSKTHMVSRETSLAVILDTLRRQPPVLLVVAGGDGTISTTLGRLYDCGIEFAIIPLGTTNNIARSLRIPLHLDAAIDAISERSGVYIDLGDLGGEKFANVASLGVSAQIALRVTDRSKQKLGRVAYVWEGFRAMLFHKPVHVVIEDSARNITVHIRTHQLVIANGIYHAGREIASDASVDDGQLLVFALGDHRKISFIIATLGYMFGRARRISYGSYFVARDINIQTSKKYPVEIDGEVKRYTPAAVAVQKSAVKVRC